LTECLKHLPEHLDVRRVLVDALKLSVSHYSQYRGTSKAGACVTFVRVKQFEICHYMAVLRVAAFADPQVSVFVLLY
jgi:hypothetical protein